MIEFSHLLPFVRRNKNTMPKLVSGFTIVEMIVSIAIVGVIMSTVFYNYSTFNDNLALSSAGQELAISIRQAQTYGLTVKEVTPGGGQFNSAYGIYFDPINDPTNYYIFADLNANKMYDAGGGCGGASGTTECVMPFIFQNNIKVSSICDGSSCPPSNAQNLAITFLRPNPDANINFITSGIIVAGPSVTGRVVLTSPKGKTLTLTIESTGQVLVGQII